MKPAYLSSTRIGIELSPGACRIVEIDVARSGPDGEDLTRVRSFGVLPPSGPDLHAALIAHRQRDAAVVVWGTPSEHRQVVVDAAPYDTMRGEAFHAMEQAGIATRGMLADIAPVGSGPWLSAPEDLKARRIRRNIVVALAPAAEIKTALEPIVDAGIRVRAVMTPAAALNSLAKLRQAFTAPGAIEIHIAVEEFATCIALLRDGALLAARDLPWGYEEGGGRTGRRSTEEVVDRLLEETHEFLAAIEAPKTAVRRVCLYGGVPDPRAVAEWLTTGLDVDVDFLDTLFGIDDSQLPEAGDEFRRRCAELRLAWVAAAAWPPALNVMRPSAARIKRSKRAAVGAGIAAGFLAGWQIDRTDWWQAAEATVIGLVVADQAAITGTSAAAGSASTSASAAGPARTANPPPFPVVLGMIFYSQDRPIALVDGRVVGVGDRVRETEVVQITATTVVLRDAAGRTWQLTRGGQ